MLVVDVILIAILIAAVVSGLMRGFFASIGTLIGLIAGAAAALWLVPLLASFIPAPGWRAFTTVAASIAFLALGSWAGSALGLLVRRGVDRTPLRPVERLFGGVASLVIAALTVSLVGSAIAAVGIPTVSSAVASSRVLNTIENLTPEPVAAGIAQLRADVLDGGLPSLGLALPGTTTATQPPVALDDPALATAAQSVARISGTAYACGMNVTGTGFVIAAGRLITNAHVVAGVDRPMVELPGRTAREGRVVYFDPNKDLAIVSVPGLDAAPLRLVAPLQPGASAVAEGYPYGGPFTVTPARVLSTGDVSVPNIYNNGDSVRSVYALEAGVKPGNSGGPLLTAQGTVAGLVFARDEKDASRGYAETTDELAPIVRQAESLQTPVASTRCTG
ncbi:MarP family serine protease [Microbacterium candidum]|uniref:MarP family serine protease n=1 Tax=Microbacterium candidum TaxID=3041922 RepID=A0ABT7N298_9MICO|nr:MarP family serine protease [Microbacterium sp. ASV49]MDL9980834.1 MarP family serine protease [Microbacterium sp. ASV49]